MKRPVPPSNFRSSGDTAEDLRRIRQHQQEILDWIDDQIDAIPAGVTSFNTRTGAVLPTSGDYTATQVGLGNVTNDAQLKRAGSDWSGFTTQTGPPVTGDKFLIERASDSAKRVVLAQSFAAYSLRDPIWDRPTTPSADDEEFDTDPFDPATPGGARGWNIGSSGTPGTGLTRDGAISLTANIASGHYRSSCIGGTLFIQLRVNEFALIWRTVAAAITTSQVWFAAVNSPSEPATTNINNPFIGLSIYKNLSGAPDNNNRHAYRFTTNPEKLVLTTIAGGVSSADVIGPGFPAAGSGLAIHVDHPTTVGTNFAGFPWTRTGWMGFVCQSQTSTLAFNASTDKIGITIGANSTVQVEPFVTATSPFAIHFLRRVPTASGWLAQA